MLHARKDYNRRIQDKECVIPEDEPVFLLRGQDKHAPNLLEVYAHRVQRNPDHDKVLVANTLAQAEAMKKWQEEHGSSEPDMNPEDALYPADKELSETETSAEESEESEDENEEE